MRKISFLSTSLVGLLLTAGTVTAESAPRNFTAHLSGDQERPQAVDTDAQGELILHLSKDGDEVDYKLIAEGLDGITSADLYLIQNTDGTGPLVANLYNPSADDDLPGAVLTDGALQPSDLKGPLSGKTLAELSAAVQDGKVYVNVLTRLNTAGAIRGDFDLSGQDAEQDSTTTATTRSSTASATVTATSVPATTATSVPTASVTSAVVTGTPTATLTENSTSTGPGRGHANDHADQAQQDQP